jgi:hypothetical protein
VKFRVLFVAITLFACGQGAALAAVPQGEHYEAHCKEPLPIFTLGEYSQPTKAQEAALCACIWKNLGGWQREVSEKIPRGKTSEISEMHMRAFPPRFGSALEKCGGMKL